jgi:bacterioferritin-associated ferredoxin
MATEVLAVYVCICHGIRERDLREAVERGAQSFEALQARTGVATCCRTCESTARALVDETLATRSDAIQAA